MPAPAVNYLSTQRKRCLDYKTLGHVLVYHTIWLGLLLLATSCSERPITLWRNYQSYLDRGDVVRARELLEQHRKDLLADPLLAAMELGALAFYEQKWADASLEFERAFQLLGQRRLRLTQYLSKQIISRESEDYLPSPVEYSYLHYFQVLSFWKQYEQSGQAQDLFKARAVLVKWHQYLALLKEQAPKESTYREDFFAPYVASLIHQHIGSGGDGEIALQLSLDALQLLKADKADKSAQELLLGNYLRLLKKHRSPSEVKAALATFSLSELPSSAKELQRRMLFYHRGLVTPKVALPLGFSLFGASGAVSGDFSSAQITLMSQGGFLSFATNMLAVAGLIYRGSNSSAVRRQWPLAIQGMLVVSNGLYYEVATREDFAAIPAPAQVGAQPLRSLSVMAKAETDWEAERDILTSGARFLAKHLLALVASYSLVARDWGKSPEERQSGSSGLLFLSAVGSYMAAAQLINWSERADLRCWHGLFSEIAVAQGDFGTQGPAGSGPGFFFPTLGSNTSSP